MEFQKKSRLSTLLSKRYVVLGSIFSCLATTSGNHFSAVDVDPPQFRIAVSAFRAIHRVLEE